MGLEKMWGLKKSGDKEKKWDLKKRWGLKKKLGKKKVQNLNVSNIVHKNIVDKNIVHKNIVDKNIVDILNRYENFEYTKPTCRTLEEWLRTSLLVSKIRKKILGYQQNLRKFQKTSKKNLWVPKKLGVTKFCVKYKIIPSFPFSVSCRREIDR